MCGILNKQFVPKRNFIVLQLQMPLPRTFSHDSFQGDYFSGQTKKCRGREDGKDCEDTRTNTNKLIDKLETYSFCLN